LQCGGSGTIFDRVRIRPLKKTDLARIQPTDLDPALLDINFVPTCLQPGILQKHGLGPFGTGSAKLLYMSL
jgi:hypothetical protein